MRKFHFLALCLAIISLALSGCDSGSAAQPTPTTGVQSTPTAVAPSTPTAAAATTSRTPEKVTFALDWTPNTNHTGIYVAQQKGWYKDAGLEVQILPYSDANTPDTLVATGQADFGVSFAESVVLDRVSNLPVKSVA